MKESDIAEAGGAPEESSYFPGLKDGIKKLSSSNLGATETLALNEMEPLEKS